MYSAYQCPEQCGTVFVQCESVKDNAFSGMSVVFKTRGVFYFVPFKMKRRIFYPANYYYYVENVISFVVEEVNFDGETFD